MGPFFVWLLAFYTVWTVVVSAGGHWIAVAGHWPIALTMAFGSFVAGSTPMGGGTVGFPVLVLLFGQEATMGRDFSFAVQSIGMTSASIFILCHRLPVETTMLRWAHRCRDQGANDRLFAGRVQQLAGRRRGRRSRRSAGRIFRPSSRPPTHSGVRRRLVLGAILLDVLRRDGTCGCMATDGICLFSPRNPIP
jgi:hypothetical protein